MSESEIRKDYFLKRYVIITPGRAKRPRDVHEKSLVERVGPCVFCPGNVENDVVLKKFPKAPDGEITVLNNKFSAVTPDNEKAYGHQEVIVETSTHGLELAELSVGQIEQILKVYANRTAELSKDKKIEYILVFKNQGGRAGASLLHSHSQVFASQILPPDIMDELQAAHKYQLEKGVCPYCDIIKKESGGEREIFNDQHFLVIAPYASAYHYETWFLNKRHVDNITNLNNDEFKSFAKALKMILEKQLSLGLDYNFFMHQVIKDENQHFYLKIEPRESIWAGVELGSGIVINSVAPETAAKFFKS